MASNKAKMEKGSKSSSEEKIEGDDRPQKSKSISKLLSGTKEIAAPDNSSDEDDSDYVPGEESDESSEDEAEAAKNDPSKPQLSEKEQNELDKKKMNEVWEQFLSLEPSFHPNMSEKAVKDTDKPPQIKKEEAVKTEVKPDPAEIIAYSCSTTSSGSDSKDPPKSEPDADTSSIKQVASKAPVVNTGVKRKGLDGALSSLFGKNKKMNVLQKSLSDWNEFKKEEGISEDLQTYNRGRNGFIERQRFLERSDVRTYEVERDIRLTKRK